MRTCVPRSLRSRLLVLALMILAGTVTLAACGKSDYTAPSQ
jgi:hypothetical protein